MRVVRTFGAPLLDVSVTDAGSLQRVAMCVEKLVQEAHMGARNTAECALGGVLGVDF